MDLRLLKTGHSDAALNMGIDEAILNAVAEGKSPSSLRLYGWTPAAVSVGYFQGLADEIDLDACATQGVDAVRRVTGGGAVFHERELTYSLVVPLGHALAPENILESYRVICGGLIAGFARFGVKAEFAPINDIVSGGKKVSGNAQTRKKGCLLQHGTILLAVDVDRMFSLLKVPAEKLKGKLIEDVKARVSSLELILGRPVSFDEAVESFTEGFSEAWGATLIPGELSTSERAEGERIAREKYASAAWNGKR